MSTLKKVNICNSLTKLKEPYDNSKSPEKKVGDANVSANCVGTGAAAGASTAKTAHLAFFGKAFHVASSTKAILLTF